MQFGIHQISRRGPRPENQDRVAYAYSKKALLAVLADGMGGHLHGEIAARVAVQVMMEPFQRLALPTLRDPARFLRDHIRLAHDGIVRQALQQDLAESPCTTLVAALVQDGVLYCAHAGDSRLYHFRDGRPLFCTEDHSRVQLLFRQGEIGREQMRTHPQRHVIYNCLGGTCLPHVELAPPRRLEAGDVVLLCSDGVWSQLDGDEMAHILRQGPLALSAAALLDLAEARAGAAGDNMSAVAFRWNSSDNGGISTAAMPLNQNAAVHGRAGEAARVSSPSAEERSLDAIEYTIAEIQLALRKSGK